jgi:hypothetical protein
VSFEASSTSDKSMESWLTFPRPILPTSQFILILSHIHGCTGEPNLTNRLVEPPLYYSSHKVIYPVAYLTSVILFLTITSLELDIAVVHHSHSNPVDSTPEP